MKPLIHIIIGIVIGLALAVTVFYLFDGITFKTILIDTCEAAHKVINDYYTDIEAKGQIIRAYPECFRD